MKGETGLDRYVILQQLQLTQNSTSHVKMFLSVRCFFVSLVALFLALFVVCVFFVVVGFVGFFLCLGFFLSAMPSARVGITTAITCHMFTNTHL